MRTETIAYQVDGRDMVGLLAVGDGDHKRPAVLVCHEGPGQDENARNYARRLAELGYIAFALDYVGGGKPETDRDRMMKRIMELMADPERAVAIGQAGLDILLKQPEADAARTASIGFCFGGTLSFQMARAGVPLTATVGFHAGLGTKAPAQEGIKTKILALIGADDPMISPEQRDVFVREMTTAKADWQLVLYGGVEHSYTNPKARDFNMPGIKYDETAERRAWQAMKDLFAEVF